MDKFVVVKPLCDFEHPEGTLIQNYREGRFEIINEYEATFLQDRSLLLVTGLAQTPMEIDWNKAWFESDDSELWLVYPEFTTPHYTRKEGVIQVMNWLCEHRGIAPKSVETMLVYKWFQHCSKEGFRK